MDNLQVLEPKLLTNDNESSFYQELILSLKTCNRFYFSVAFINYSGLQLLLDVFKELETNNINGKIITSTYLNFTDVKSLRKLSEFNNIESRVYRADNHKGFHTKAYIFEDDEKYKIIIGSSNITQSALKSNVEWNVKYISKKDASFPLQVINEFHSLWDLTNEINDDFLLQYEEYLNRVIKYVKQEKELFEYTVEIKPNSMQLEALKSLNTLRENNQDKALIIAATGTGKTYLSAFDVRQMNPKRVLFLVHRRKILDDAKKSFKKVHPDRITTIFQGSKKETNAEFTFAMIQTISKKENLQMFNHDNFDYIIYDEAHRAFSKSYQRVMNYFTPKFTLGMTATPERTDGGNIFERFNNNIALEVRLRDALKEDLVTPFHYFGITDVTTDLSNVDLTKIDLVAEKLSIKERVDLIIEKMLHYGYSGNKRKCLGFCATKAHANYMANEFNAFGYPSIALTGESSDDERDEAIKRLEKSKDELEFIFTVDIFNEGVDIPSVNMVLMLRPTQSPIIFTQQLGRGLRKHNSKDFLTVLDFIGNHNKSFLIPIALSGTKYYDKDSLKIQVSKDFNDIPGCTNIKLDQIVKEQILNQLDRVNFNSMEYLRKEYNDFKNVLGGKKPSMLDFIQYESAPDPVKFILKEDSYIEFQSKMENQKIETTSMEHIKVLQTIDKMLPIKRINEFVILKELLEKNSITYNLAKEEINKMIEHVEEESIRHSFT
jgi:superfamily II DNA or RNA helicase/HKD family nuclease